MPGVGGRAPRRNARYSSTSVVVSATECTASESIAADPEITPAMSLATAMARLAAPATTTVATLSVLTSGWATTSL